MFTGVFLFVGFIFFSFYRYFVTYSARLAGSWWAAYYLWFYLFMLSLFCVDLYHVYKYEVVEFDWLRDTDKFGLNALPEAERERYYLPNWLRVLSLTTPVFVILVFLVSLAHTVQHHWHIRSMLTQRFAVGSIHRDTIAGTDDADFSDLRAELKTYLQYHGVVSPGKADNLEGGSEDLVVERSAPQQTTDARDSAAQRASDSTASSGKRRVTKDPFLEALFPHDLSIQVIALPCVYSMMAFKSVVRVWMMMTGSTHNATRGQIERRKQQLLDYYESNYQLADLYEAWAIWCFSRLCVRQVKNIMRQEQWTGTAKRLFKPLSSITLLGVNAFVLVYGIMQPRKPLFLSPSCFYQLTISVVKKTVSVDIEDLPVVGGAIETVGTYISGAGFVASCLALYTFLLLMYNIILFETQLHEWLERFDPFWKFWGAKILVSLAFLQTFLLKLVLVDVFRLLTVPQEMLFYSTLTTIECLPIAVLHFKAWNHNSDWYADAEWMLGSHENSQGKNSEAGSPRYSAARAEQGGLVSGFAPKAPSAPRVNVLLSPGASMRSALVKPLLVQAEKK